MLERVCYRPITPQFRNCNRTFFVKYCLFERFNIKQLQQQRDAPLGCAGCCCRCNLDVCFDCIV